MSALLSLYCGNFTLNNLFDTKQLLDEVFVISRIIKLEVGAISQSRRLRLINLTETLIILDITKAESNNCFITHSAKKKMATTVSGTDNLFVNM